LPELPVYDRIFPCERCGIIREDSVKEESFFQMDIEAATRLWSLDVDILLSAPNGFQIRNAVYIQS